MKTLVIQILRSQVKLHFPKEAVFTITDMETVKKCLKGNMREGSFMMHSEHICKYKVCLHRKPVQMDMFKK